MNIVLDTSNYIAKDIVVADAILQPNIFKSRFEELKGRLTGETKDFYGSFFEEATNKAKIVLAEKIKNGGYFGVTDIKVATFLKEVRGDVFIGATIQAIAVDKLGGNDA